MHGRTVDLDSDDKECLSRYSEPTLLSKLTKSWHTVRKVEPMTQTPVSDAVVQYNNIGGIRSAPRSSGWQATRRLSDEM